MSLTVLEAHTVPFCAGTAYQHSCRLEASGLTATISRVYRHIFVSKKHYLFVLYFIVIIIK